MKDNDERRYQTGAAARIACMPAATLRVWERRYGVAKPDKSTSGQRLYTHREVQRLVVLKKLVSSGYAIGTIASLEDAALFTLLSAPPEARADARSPLTITAIGKGWQHGGATAVPTHTHWTFHADLQLACAAAVGPCDWLVIRQASLHADSSQQILTLADRLQVSCVAVTYTFGTEVAVDVLRMAGAQLFRERGGPISSEVLFERVDRWNKRHLNANSRVWGRASRRYGDEELRDAARLSKVLACECPTHLVDLIRQIGAFESYSDKCESMSASDALMHRYFGDVASRARELFEQALGHVGQQEHLPHPASADK